MGELLLASCAQEVAMHVLSGNCSTIVRETVLQDKSSSARLTSLDFDPHGQALIMSRDDGNVGLCQVEKNQNLGGLPIPVDQRGAVNAVAFCNKSRYAATAAEDGYLRLWDLKMRRVAQSYNAFTTPATCISFNMDSAQVAAGSTSGDLTVFSLTSNKRIAVLKTPTEENRGSQQPAAPIRAVHFNPFRRDIVATCSDSGSVYVWDTTTLSIKASFPKAHRGAASDISFSPANRTLLMSVGLDGAALMMDSSRSTILRKTTLDYALTSLSFAPSGDKVALGTSTGLVLLCELRGGMTILQKIEVHAPHPVARVRFYIPSPSGKSMSSAMNSSRASSTSRTQSSSRTQTSRASGEVRSSTSLSSTATVAGSSAPTATTNTSLAAGEINSSDAELLAAQSSRVQAQLRKPRQTTHSDLFSPAKPPPMPSGRSHANASQLGPIEEDQSPQSAGSNQVSSLAKLALAPGAIGSDSDNKNVTASSHSQESSQAAEPPLSPRPELAPTPGPVRGSQNVKSSLRAQDADITPGPRSVPNTSQSQGARRDTPPRRDEEATSVLSMISESKRSADFETPNDLTNNNKTSNVALSPAATMPAEWMTQVENMIDDVRQDVREDVQNVQLEMMRQFRLQMSDIRQILDTYTSKFADLVEENNRLRAENERLRNLY